MEVKVRYVDAFEGAFQNVKDELSKQDPVVLGVAVAVLVVLLTIVVIYLAKRKNNKNSVLLVGLCDAGKTLLFSRLVHNRFVHTFTSIKENSGIYQVTDKKRISLEVIDIPGNDRQRMQFWERFKSQARGLIFVIDSATFQTELKEVAEFLYTILSDCLASHSKLPVLIACNKQDLTTAKSCKIVQEKLEKEINLLRVARAASLGSTDGSSTTDLYLGAKGKDFRFSQLHPVDIEFAECSAKAGNDESSPAELNVLEDWIHAVA